MLPLLPKKQTITLLRRLAKRNWSSARGRGRLEQLEAAANRSPADPAVQAEFLGSLNQTHPELVVRRVRSGRFALGEAVFREYVRALALTKRVDATSAQEIIAPLESSGQAAFGSTVQASAHARPLLGVAGAAGGPSAEPILVQLAEPGFKSQMWRTLRTLAVMGAVIWGLSMTVGSSGSAGRLLVGMNNEVKPTDAQGKTFDNVKGADEAKGELQEIVSYLRDPSKFTRLGGKLPKGVLLMGPPGTGKTLLAKAVAGEADVPFFYASGSEFEEMYVGIGARRVRDLFAAAKNHAPCIIFIDEIDAIGSTRALKEQQAMKMTLNQLLVELDGFKETEGVIVMGATNFPEVLDPALVRPGRFDRHVAVPLPDMKGRTDILQMYLNDVPTAADVDATVIARGTPGASGAELSNLVNMAALRASVAGSESVNLADLEFAKDKIAMGGERRSAIIPPEVKKLTAYHEGGHALVALHTRGAMPIHKATIMPRGQALGMVHQLPEEADMLQRSKRQMLAELDVCMGGRVAEELIFGKDEVTSGASSDIQKATSIARRMVMNYGMDSSGKVGIVYVPNEKREQQGRISSETLRQSLTLLRLGSPHFAAF